MDILKRLRESVQWIVTNTTVPTRYIQVMDDAHDEIVKLRAAQPRNAGDVAPIGGDDEHSGDLAQRA